MIERDLKGVWKIDEKIVYKHKNCNRADKCSRYMPGDYSLIDEKQPTNEEE